jgi:hypothetical protein
MIKTMTAKQFSELLSQLHACGEATTWAKGKSLRGAWRDCGRGDWMLWLCGRMVGKPGWPSRRDVVLAACDCAELALEHVEDQERSRKCIETIRAWTEGEATIEEVRIAGRTASYATYAAYDDAYAAYDDAAYAAYDAYAAASAAADAAYAAADAAYAAYAAYAAASAAYDAYAAYAAADAAADAAYAGIAKRIRAKTLAKCAELIRKRITVR